MENHENHITSYATNGKILIALLALTFITVAVTSLDLGGLTIAVALLIACVKAYTVLTYFMHLKYESAFFRYMVIGVLVLFALIIGMTFFDYAFR